MPKKPITVAEAGRRGGRSTVKKYGKAQLKKWGALGADRRRRNHRKRS